MLDAEVATGQCHQLTSAHRTSLTFLLRGVRHREPRVTRHRGQGPPVLPTTYSPCRGHHFSIYVLQCIFAVTSSPLVACKTSKGEPNTRNSFASRSRASYV